MKINQQLWVNELEYVYCTTAARALSAIRWDAGTPPAVKSALYQMIAENAIRKRASAGQECEAEQSLADKIVACRIVLKHRAFFTSEVPPEAI